jgi:hypothetical protein
MAHGDRTLMARLFQCVRLDLKGPESPKLPEISNSDYYKISELIKS